MHRTDPFFSDGFDEMFELTQTGANCDVLVNSVDSGYCYNDWGANFCNLFLMLRAVGAEEKFKRRACLSVPCHPENTCVLVKDKKPEQSATMFNF